MKAMKKTTLAVLINTALFSAASYAADAQVQDQVKTNQLEVISVTARKRVENAQEIPVSVSALQGDNLDAYSSAGMDIRFMNAKIPSLSVESSFGRSFPRFYVRGLGNTDFDLNASQPVSLVVDDVVQENPILKGFPVFDVERVEVLRGPQGTLFGRNTPAGLVKFDSVKPSQEFDGFASISYGSQSAIDFKGAVGGGLTDNLSTRVSLLVQDKNDFIDSNYIDVAGNEITEKDVLGGYNEKAARVQFLYENDNFTALTNIHQRDLDGKPIVFHANLTNSGSNEIRSGFNPDVVHQDASSNATQQVKTKGASLKLEFDFENHTLTSVSGWESAEIYSRADVDGGYGAVFMDHQGPGTILFAAESADAIPDHDQLTQELRLSSNLDGQINYQVGVFYFNEDLTIESFSFDTFAGGAQNGYAKQIQDTSAWAVFGSVDYDLSEQLSVTAGLRYSDDEKDFSATRTQNPTPWNGSPDYLEGATSANADHISWDLSAAYKYTDNINLFARVANGFRAPSIQGRILFGDEITVADSETITSFETGIKSDVLDGRGRVNATIFYFEMNDQQLTAVGGDANFNRLINANKTNGYGVEIDSEWILTDEINATFNISYNNTELSDNDLAVATCAQCTVTDSVNSGGLAQINGNSLPHAPEWISNFTLRYTKELENGEFYAYTDWSYRSEINFFLYESTEFTGEALLEGGLRVGYQWAVGDNEYEVAAFGRNITDQEVIIGGVDFNNNTGIVNEGRYVGAEFKVNFF